MPTSYNQITGQSLERLAALSDGIFAVAMTLLVLDLHVPARELIHSQGELWHTLAGAAPQLISYMMSFMTLGIFWNGQQAQLNSFTQSDRQLSWIHIAFLFLVSVMPFSTRLLAEFISYRTVLVAYWANILLPGCGAVRELALCETSRSVAGRDYPSETMCHGAADRRGPGALCIWYVPVPGKHLPQHRVYCPGAAELRPGAAPALSFRNLGATAARILRCEPREER